MAKTKNTDTSEEDLTMKREVMRAVVIDPKDNVATVSAELEAGTTVAFRVGGRARRVKLRDSIPIAHKFAIKKIEKDGDVVKCGKVIGRATKPIEIGEHVHIHNVVSAIL